MNKKIYYNFNQDSYDLAQKRYKEKLDLEDAIREQYVLLGIKNKPHTFLYDEILIQAGQSYKDVNVMGLKIPKLFDLLELDFETVKKLLVKYKAVRDIKEPTKSGHSAFANTPAKKQRLAEVFNFIKLVEGFHYKMNIHMILKAAQPVFYIFNGKLQPDQGWIDQADSL